MAHRAGERGGKQTAAGGLPDAAALGQVDEQVQAAIRIAAARKRVVGERRHRVAHEEVVDERAELAFAAAPARAPRRQRPDPLRAPQGEQDERLVEGGVVQQARCEACRGLDERSEVLQQRVAGIRKLSQERLAGVEGLATKEAVRLVGAQAGA